MIPAAGAEFRAWIASRLEPLDGEPADPEAFRSDFDLNDGRPSPDSLQPLAPASVLIGLVEREAGLSVILTRRADTLRRHTGQIALPGGRRDPGETAAQTALREAQEEIGLDPSLVTLAGRSTTYRTGTGFLITPVVGFVSSHLQLTPNPAEVAEIFETPFGFLMDPNNLEQHEREATPGQRRRFYAFTHQERFIWGVTAGVLRALYQRLYGVEGA